MSAAIAILLAGLSGLAEAQNVLEEILVTATNRSASAEDIAVAVTALGDDALDQLNITSFDDYAK